MKDRIGRRIGTLIGRTLGYQMAWLTKQAAQSRDSHDFRHLLVASHALSTDACSDGKCSLDLEALGVAVIEVPSHTSN